jgi:hypothetical protein
VSVSLRPAMPADAEPLARGMVEGMEAYRSETLKSPAVLFSAAS